MLQAAYSNPFRVPNWRWLRAVGCVERTQPRPSRKRDGHAGFGWIRRASQFLQAMAALDDNDDRDAVAYQLAEAYPAIWWAKWLYDDPQPSLRLQIEAHILARGNDADIGYAAGVSPQVVEAYESLFYNVRDRLNFVGYIVHHVIGPAVHQGLREHDYGLLWKLYGYFSGPQMLHALVTKFPNPGWATSADMVGSVVQDSAINTLKLKADIAAKTVPVNSDTQLALLDIFTKFVEVERTTDTAGKAQSQLLDSVSAMMASLPFGVAGRDPRKAGELLPAGPLSVYRKSGIELSFAESLAVATGQPLPNQDMILQLGGTDSAGNSTAFPATTGGSS